MVQIISNYARDLQTSHLQVALNFLSMYFNIFTIPKISNQERVIENSKSVDEEEGKLTDKYMEDINKTFAVFDKDNSLEMI